MISLLPTGKKSIHAKAQQANISWLKPAKISTFRGLTFYFKGNGSQNAVIRR